MPLTVPRRYPRCLPFFLFVASICFTYLHHYIAMFLVFVCVLVVSVKQNCPMCLCCFGVFVVVRVVLYAVFPDHSIVFYCCHNCVVCAVWRP